MYCPRVSTIKMVTSLYSHPPLHLGFTHGVYTFVSPFPARLRVFTSINRVYASGSPKMASCHCDRACCSIPEAISSSLDYLAETQPRQPYLPLD